MTCPRPPLFTAGSHGGFQPVCQLIPVAHGRKGQPIMKKETVYSWILRQRDLITRKEKNVVLRKAKFAALKQCEEWLLALTWAQMRAPVTAKRHAIQEEKHPLVEKARQDPALLTKQETTRVEELDVCNEIYAQFLHKITPTARQAEFERDQRQREQARRTSSRQGRKS